MGDQCGDGGKVMIKSRPWWSIWEFIYKGCSTINRYRVNWRVFRRTAHTLSKEFKNSGQREEGLDFVVRVSRKVL